VVNCLLLARSDSIGFQFGRDEWSVFCREPAVRISLEFTFINVRLCIAIILLDFAYN